MTSAYLTGALRFPRNNPVFNISNTLTWLKGRHTLTFGGTYRQSSLVEPSGGEPEQFSLGVAAGDPVSGIFNATTMPGPARRGPGERPGALCAADRTSQPDRRRAQHRRGHASSTA